MTRQERRPLGGALLGCSVSQLDFGARELSAAAASSAPPAPSTCRQDRLSPWGSRGGLHPADGKKEAQPDKDSRFILP